MADILVVEDDRAILRGLKTNLEFEGHVSATSNAETKSRRLFRRRRQTCSSST